MSLCATGEWPEKFGSLANLEWAVRQSFHSSFFLFFFDNVRQLFILFFSFCQDGATLLFLTGQGNFYLTRWGNLP